jgi:hypothetical protein
MIQDELDGTIGHWVGWYRWRRSLRWGLRGLPAGLGFALLAGLILIGQRRLLAVEFIGLFALCGLIGLGIGLAAGYAWRLDRIRLVRWFDLQLGLQERMSTALELQNSPQVDIVWRQRQVADALAAAKQVEIARQIPLRIERGPLGVTLGALLGLVGVIFLAQAIFQQVLDNRQVQQSIWAEKERTEALVKEIEKNEQLTPAQREALTRPLQEAMRSLEEANTREQALAAMREAEQELHALQDSSTAKQLQSLQTTGQRLKESDVSGLKNAGDALSKANLAQAAEQLKNMDLAGLDAKQQQELAQDLEQAAQDLKQDNPELSKQLQDAAQALRQGNPQAAQQALQQGAQSLEQVELRAIQSQQAAQAAEQLRQSQNAVAQSGEAGQPGDGGAGGQPGKTAQGGKSGQGSSGTPSPQEGASGGAGRGAQTTALPPGGEVSKREIEQNNGAGDGGESKYEKIYAPERVGGQHDLGLGVPPSGQVGDQTIGQQPSIPGKEGQSQVPYTDALPAYSDAYRQAIQNGQVPAYLRPLIRKYFSSLEP